MLSDPYKLKEVKKLHLLEPFQRVEELNRAGCNTFRLPSDCVTFDLLCRGTGGWSHFQKAALQIGDEAYAGSANFYRLVKALDELVGINRIVPVHNGIGAEKLLVTTMLKPGQAVAHNRGLDGGLVAANGGESLDLSVAPVPGVGPEGFGGNLDLERLEQLLAQRGPDGCGWVHLQLCPPWRNGQPCSLANVEGAAALTRRHGLPLVLDISSLMTNSFWISQAEQPSLSPLQVARRLVAAADIVVMDAGQDCRCDVGGFIMARNDEYHERFANKVVVFEGLHTYGGMSGRAMEVFACGVAELSRIEYVHWHQQQIKAVADRLAEAGVPAVRGGLGVALEVGAFLPHLRPEELPKFALAAALYVQGGLRGPIEGPWDYQVTGSGAGWLPLEIPRSALNRNHLNAIAGAIIEVHRHRQEIGGLKLCNCPEFVDEAQMAPVGDRVLVPPALAEAAAARPFEPYRTSVFEPVRPTDKAQREAAMAEAGYNTFLLRSEEIYIDFLTDSGTAAMSTWQWEGMTDGDETPYSSRSFDRLERTFREILGYQHILPTHQGRAAEHIMSQVMIKPGQIVPGNMYFTTTKLHQEMAGGIFVDIIVDAAHDSTSDFPWKGNIDIAKLEREIARVGADNVAYISFEMAVNMAGGQPFSMANAREVCALCHRHKIPVMFDATRCVENAEMVRRKDPAYANRRVADILREMLSYGDGCTISCKKDFLVNMGGMLACNDADLATRFRRMLRTWEGDVTNGGMAVRDMEALYRGLLESLDDDYIRMRVEQTQEFGRKLQEAGVPIVTPPGTHAIFIDARRFLPHIDQDQYPAQALASAIYIETGVRTMERGNVSKGRNPQTGQNYRPQLELVRCTIPRRVYTPSHFDYIVKGIAHLYEHREKISGLKFVYEPPVLRFFQSRFEPLKPWNF